MKIIQKISFSPGSLASGFLLVTMLLAGALAMHAEAQQLRVGKGAHLVNGVYLAGGTVINKGSIQNIATGVITIGGNWQNDSSFSASPGSTVTFNGASSQQIGGTRPTTFSNLTLSNSNGCTLASTVDVEGTLDFQGGLLTTSADTIKIGPSGNIANANASKYVNGKLAFIFSGTGSRLFPVGKGGVYRPVNFRYSALSGVSTVTVEQFETTPAGTLPVNTYMLTPGRYWNIGQTGGSSMQYFLTLDATGSVPSFPVVLLRNAGGNLLAAPATSPNYTNTTAMTAFGSFTLGEQCPVHTISGYAKYYNNPKTPLNGLKILLRKGAVYADSVITSANGYYEFANLDNGTYGLKIKSADPGGQWQTWGGVNNTDYLLVAKHAAGTSLLPDVPPVERIAASVKLPHPLINTIDADAIKKAGTFGWGSPPYFDIPKWVFSGPDLTTRIDTFPVACANVTRDIYGLCAGDVNGTYVPPNGYKQAGPELQVVCNGTLPVTGELVFPVRPADNLELGAVTLMLDYNPALIDVTRVEMPQNGGNKPSFLVTDAGTTGSAGVLSIGWMSLNPVTVSSSEPLFLIHARVKDPGSFKPGSSSAIRFSLDQNPLSELADGDGNVLPGVKLLIPDAGATRESSGFQGISPDGVIIYPNPAAEILHIEFILPADGPVNLELANLQGITVMQSGQHQLTSGWHDEHLNTGGLPPGVYFLRVTAGGKTILKKVIHGNL